jgi:hypothetical protein
MPTHAFRARLLTGAALALLLSTGCAREAEVPAEGTAETEAPAGALGRAPDATADDSTEAAAEDGPGVGGGYDE